MGEGEAAAIAATAADIPSISSGISGIPIHGECTRVMFVFMYHICICICACA